MNIHEYQAKQVLKKYGVPVLPGGVAYTADEAAKVAEGLPQGVYVVKSQIHAGGRGKGTFKEAAAGGKGGVRVVKSVADVKEAARQMIGNTFAPPYLPAAPRRYTTKAKNAQEAHEAIRPTDPSRTPQQVLRFLEPEQAKLYELIWKRTIASQMESAELERTTVDILVEAGGRKLEAIQRLRNDWLSARLALLTDAERAQLAAAAAPLLRLVSVDA